MALPESKHPHNFAKSADPSLAGYLAAEGDIDAVFTRNVDPDEWTSLSVGAVEFGSLFLD